LDPLTRLFLQLINFEDLWNGYILLWGGYHGVLWQSGVNQRPSGEYAANGAYYLMANQGGWNPVIRSGRGDAALRLKSMSCNIGSNAAENSYATVVGTLAGRVRSDDMDVNFARSE
jgi:hypothetical protein